LASIIYFLVFLQETIMSFERPNVLIVLTDDQGLGDCSFYGNPVLQTPHMDALARGGVHFDQFHVTAMCTPTRGAMLSGVHPLSNGAMDTKNGRHSLRPDLPVLPQSFREAGYRTALIGKWHLGRNWPNRPQDKGFEHFRGFYGFGPTGISSRWNNDYQNMWLIDEQGNEQQSKGFCTDALFDESLAWMTDCAQAGEPFFCLLATNAPHFPFWGPKDLAAKYAQTKNPEFFAMMDNLDQNLGRLETFLQERDLVENTIVIFMSDNGPVGGKSTWNAGMTGGKGTPWEGGHRVPCFVRHPASGITGGRQIDGLAAVTDLYPTLLELCQIPGPKAADFDGISLAGAMRGQSVLPERQLTMQINRGELTPKMAAIMKDRWRLLWTDSLYDLERDPQQQVNRIHEHPEVFVELWYDYNMWYNQRRHQAEERLPEHIGQPQQERVVLDGSHAMDGEDGHVSVRQAKKLQGNWLVEAHRAGRYRISLRRWPVESGLALDAGCPAFETACSGPALPAGQALPITGASLEVDGFLYRQTLANDPRAVHFELELTAGRHELRGLLLDAEQRAIASAYYAEVQLLATD